MRVYLEVLTLVLTTGPDDHGLTWNWTRRRPRLSSVRRQAWTRVGKNDLATDQTVAVPPYGRHGGACPVERARSVLVENPWPD